MFQPDYYSTTDNIPAVPPEFKCPITQQIMSDPVSTIFGQTYEREAIEKWLIEQNKNTDPITNQVLKDKTLIPSLNIKKLINDFLDKHIDQLTQEKIYITKKIKDDFLSSIGNNQVEKFSKILKKYYRTWPLGDKIDGNYPIFHYICQNSIDIRLLDEFISIVSNGNPNTLIADLAQLPKPQGWRPKLLNCALLNALKSNDLYKVEILQRLGATLIKNPNEELFEAVRRGNQEDVLFLLEKMDADVSAKTKGGWFPIHVAASKKNMANIVRTLIDKGAKVEAKTDDIECNTALHLAALEGHIENVKVLLEKGANPNEKNRENSNAAQLANKNKHTEITEYINYFLEGSPDGRRLLGFIQSQEQIIKAQQAEIDKLKNIRSARATTGNCN